MVIFGFRTNWQYILMPSILRFFRGKLFEMFLYVWLCNAKNVFGSETLIGVIIVVVGRVFCLVIVVPEASHTVLYSLTLPSWDFVAS